MHVQDQASIPELSNKAQKYEKISQQWCEIMDSLTYCISKEMFPIYTTVKDMSGSAKDMSGSV